MRLTIDILSQTQPKCLRTLYKISKNQKGFVEDNGTWKDALSYITRKLDKNLDKAKPNAVAFVDLAKVFGKLSNITASTIYSICT